MTRKKQPIHRLKQINLAVISQGEQEILPLLGREVLCAHGLYEDQLSLPLEMVAWPSWGMSCLFPALITDIGPVLSALLECQVYHTAGQTPSLYTDNQLQH